MKKDPDLLICARAGAPLIVEGSILGRNCGKCGGRVMIAPSGQDFLKEHPSAEIMCANCYVASLRSQGAKAERPRMAASPERIGQEMASAKPNLWRERN